MSLLESLERARPHLESLPSGSVLAARIHDALSSDLVEDDLARVWYQLGFDVVYCTGFEPHLFDRLRTEPDFDIRWPMTFACHYWAQTGCSVDSACAEYLLGAGLGEQALEALGEYSGSEAVTMWRGRFDPLLR